MNGRGPGPADAVAVGGRRLGEVGHEGDEDDAITGTASTSAIADEDRGVDEVGEQPVAEARERLPVRASAGGGGGSAR